jgi:putative transcriptional regulator
MPKRKRVNLFKGLKEALEDAIAYERGVQVNLRVAEIPTPPRHIKPAEIRQIRRQLDVSQVRFAHLLNVSPQAVRSWEQGARRPRNAALKLLVIAKKNPHVLLVA